MTQPHDDAADTPDNAADGLTPTEATVASVWQQVLGLGQPRAEADFFDLGGHSLLAAQVAARCRQAFDTDIPMRFVLDYPTLGEFAAAIDGLMAESGDCPPR